MTISNSKIYDSLITSRNLVLENTTKIFKEVAIEGHLLGSVARGNPDPFSDLDIWFTIEDEKWDEFVTNRMRLLNQIGELIHTCEPPQNAPLNGLFTTAFFRLDENILVVDFYFCPMKSAFTTPESKNIFGNIDLPLGELSLNTQQVSVPETYRIDFFICFIFGTMKKIIRSVTNPLEAVLQQYDNLSVRYGIPVSEIKNKIHSVETLKEIISNVKILGTEKQRNTLTQIENFINKTIW